MAFADVITNLRLNIADFSAGLKQASKQMGSFASKMNKDYGDASKALTKHNLGLKDTNRIVQGILVAQTFYSGVRAIREATNAVWDFNKSLDYAHVTYSALFGDTTVATNFMSVLKEHSIETIFDYQNLADASKKLLAYGIEYKNLMFIMEGLTNLGAMSGDTEALDRISLALGQIYTRGKLTAEEMRQLANAYVPISDIIQEKFNLTPDQMGRVGDLNLPAGDVINAVVDYANERFASVGDAAMYTITGLQNKIVDTLKVVGVEMLAPISSAYKSFLAYIANGLEAIREEFDAKGVGGVFEYLVPDPNTQRMIRQFVANVHNLFMSLASVGVVLGQVFGNFAHVLVSAFNIVGPVLTSVTNVLAAALNAMLNTTAGAAALRLAILAAAASFVVLRVHAVGALVITAVSKAVMTLSKALIVLASIVTKHPVLVLLTGLAVALIGVSTASGKANSGLNNLFDTISGASGLSSSDVLQSVEKDINDSADAAEQFGERFEEGANAAADSVAGIGSAADKAKKKLGLLSFDEVFRLNEPAETSGAGAGFASDLEGLIAGFNGLGDALVPEIPDFSDFLDGFSDDLFGGLQDSLLSKLTALGLGAWFANKLANAFRLMPLTGFAAVAARIATMLLRALTGAFLGLGFDAVASILTDKLWQALEEKFGLAESASNQASLGATIGSAIGGAIGMAFFGIPGALIGAAVGHLAGGIVGLFWDQLTAALMKPDTLLGAAIGSAIGAYFGPIGLAIGALVGGIVGNFWDTIVTAVNNAMHKLGEIVWGWFNTAVTFVVDTFNNVKTSIINWFNDVKSSIINWFNEVKTTVVNWFNGIKTSIANWFNEVKTLAVTQMTLFITNIVTKLVGLKDAWVEAFRAIKLALGTWWDDMKTSMGTWLEQKIWKPMADFFNINNMWNRLKGLLNAIKDKISGWWDGITSIFSADTEVGNVTVNTKAVAGRSSGLSGHATGGIFNREHIARFAEGNKAEAVIPLENASAMQPFVDAISNGIVQTMMPMMSTLASNNAMQAEQMRPLYVGTLIADDRGLRELNRRMHVIQIQEDKRRG